MLKVQARHPNFPNSYNNRLTRVNSQAGAEVDGSKNNLTLPVSINTYGTRRYL